MILYIRALVLIYIGDSIESLEEASRELHADYDKHRTALETERQLVEKLKAEYDRLSSTPTASSHENVSMRGTQSMRRVIICR